MVYTIQRFRVVPNPLDTPISIGGYDDGPSNTPNLPTPGYGGFPFPPIIVGVPGTGTGTGTIEEPPLNQFPACPTGYARNTSTGVCEPVPLGTGQGDITGVTVPASTKVGTSSIVKTCFKNTTGQTLVYKITVKITGIIELTSPSLSLNNGQTGCIETAIQVPSTLAAGTYNGTVELKATSTAGLLYTQDSEPFSFVVTTTTTTPSPTTAVINTNKTSYVKGQTISVTGSGYQAGEKVKLWLSKDGVTRCTAGDMTATSSGNVSGSIGACYVATSGLNVRAQGRTSGRMGVRGITVTASTSPSPSPSPSPTTARISAPSSIHDGDTFRVTGTGFKGGERVTTTVSGTWRGGSYNGRTYSRSFTVTASGSGSFAVNVSTPEVPSGVSSTATIRSKGLTSGRTASRSIAII